MPTEEVARALRERGPQDDLATAVPAALAMDRIGGVDCACTQSRRRCAEILLTNRVEVGSRCGRADL